MGRAHKRPPLFSVYSDPKYVFRYNRLSAHLGPEYPVYGVQPRCADRNRVYTIEDLLVGSGWLPESEPVTLEQTAPSRRGPLLQLARRRVAAQTALE